MAARHMSEALGDMVTVHASLDVSLCCPHSKQHTAVFGLLVCSTYTAPAPSMLLSLS